MKLCECGCGEPTKIAQSTIKERGWTKGEPRRFLRGHGNRRVGVETPLQRLMRETAVEGECWIWFGARTGGGYGSLFLGGKAIGAHVLSHQLFIGSVPDGHHVHHECGNHACVRPDHLRALPPEVHRQITPRPNHAKTHCKRGHPYVGDNVIVDKRGHRQCRICRRAQTIAAKRRYRERLRALRCGPGDGSRVPGHGVLAG